MKLTLSTLLFCFVIGSALAADIVVSEGVTWFQVESAPDNAQIQDLFADQLPGGDAFAHASRILTANTKSTLGAWYDRRSGEWKGNLRQIHPGAYWLVLPPNAPESELILPGVTIQAGSVASDWGATGWLIRPSANGSINISPSEQPKSSATYRVKEKADSTWKASSGVYIQGDPQSALPSYIWVDLAPVSSGYGATRAAVPMPPGGRITVPFIPDFSTPPWEENDE
jgi:hypothetical protein